MTTLTGLVTDAATGEALAGVRVRAYRTMLWLNTALRSYAGPDTTSAGQGLLQMAAYPVLEVRAGPATGSDFVRVEASGPVWVCSRWRGTHYALLHDRALPGAADQTGADGGFTIEVPDDGVHRVRAAGQRHLDGESPRGNPSLGPLPVAMVPAEGGQPERSLVGLLQHFDGWYYTPKRPTGGGRYTPQYPYDIGVQIRLDEPHPRPPTYDDCCSFVEAVVVKAWQGAAGFAWSLERHNQSMITAAEPYSSTRVLVEAGVAIDVGVDALPAPWTVVQGWADDSDLTKGGHTFMVVDTHQETGRVLTLESNHSFWLNGPGLRLLGSVGRFLGTHWICPVDGYVYDPAVGDPPHGAPAGTPFEARSTWDLMSGQVLADDWVCPGCGTAKALFVRYCRPPLDWWKSTYVPTWEALTRRYPDRRLVRLKVRELTWLR